MNRGILFKTVREVWLSTLLFGLGLAVVEALLAHLIPQFYEQLSDQWLQMEFVQDMLKALLGSQAGDVLGPGAVKSIAWVHPIVLALIWAQEIMLCTRLPSGEVDRGTVDVLLTLPVTRLSIYLCESAVWLVSGMVLITMGLVGNLIGGASVAPDVRGAAGPLVIVVCNLYCLYVAVGGMARLVSALCDRRGRAIGIAFALVLGSFLLNSLAQFSALIDKIAFLSVLNYYRPLLILRDGGWPIADMLVLLAIGSTLWVAGAVVFTRRDICTV